MKKHAHLLSLEQILRAHQIDSLIGKPTLVTVNSEIINNTRGLKIDASIIESVHCTVILEASYQVSYNLTIKVKPISERGSNAKDSSS